MDASNPKSEIRNPKLLPPPRFGLRTLLLIVTGCAVIFALSNWLAPIALAGVVMLILSVLAHVAGNSIGTRLRELGTPRASRAAQEAALVRPEKGDFAPVTQLGKRQSLGWPIIIGTAAGTLAGGVGGGLWTVTHTAGGLDVVSIAVGASAFAVLNGIAAFVIVGFLQVGLSAMRQALANPQPSATTPRSQANLTSDESA